MSDQKLLGHTNNLHQKIKRCESENKPLVPVVNSLVAQFQDVCKLAHLSHASQMQMQSAIAALNAYVDRAKILEKENKIFNWRSNFAGGIIPEFLYHMINGKVESLKMIAYYSTASSIVEIQYIGRPEKPLELKLKDQDFCMGFSKTSVMYGDKPKEVVVPAVAFEVKTNIDINKLNGLDFSAESLKKTFTQARYYLITETIDFSLSDNYKSGHIDEVFVLRKQLRARARKSKDPLQPDVFWLILDQIQRDCARFSQTRGHVYDRLDHGKLIN